MPTGMGGHSASPKGVCFTKVFMGKPTEFLHEPITEKDTGKKICARCEKPLRLT